MKTIVIDLINEKAIDMLKGMEALELIKVHQGEDKHYDPTKILSLAGKMTKQPMADIEQQLKSMRDEWN